MASKRYRKLGAATGGERVGQIINGIFLGLMVVITIYPFWHVVMYSLSDSHASMSGGIFLWPREFSLLSYQQLLSTKQLYICYRNSLLKTLIGTGVSLLLTALTAYPLSLPRFKGRGFFSLMIFFTMLFNGGMIPTYLLIRDLHMLDTFWVYVLPAAMSAYNMFILRNFFQSIPPSLEESALLDGANPFQVLFHLVLPLSGPALAALAMFYGVALWNGYMDNVLYVNDSNLQLLQNFLRQLIAAAGAKSGTVSEMADVSAASRLTEETVKMTVITVSVIPVLIVYPFLQKYYTKGVMVGSVKG
ncbi:carbohydrate ABC transporter permease [Acutalibacter muris]|uniref:Carbohydrate ABC transporter permease n=1 Tax=Acutalibacter muris TaxID=1796620 RepID=A0A1Z2XUB2_9FIRM|nr:carbohydrate ABC transporter permease [Acutalibacter muris]ANU54737.1 sugar ABC transporter permease [Hungateiclostridiaceae bacterium KB18]ASB42032.1 carbohydrate ABC transporter permease [Acutalibacter muris]QQR31300.1 carbohydrate ABC transporter permease [Acutalibacter muris]